MFRCYLHHHHGELMCPLLKTTCFSQRTATRPATARGSVPKQVEPTDHTRVYIYIYTHTYTYTHTHIYIHIYIYMYIYGGRESSVGIATRYGLDSPGIESRWGRDFPHPSRLALGPTQPPLQWGYRALPGGAAAGAWRWPPTPSTADGKERVELYLYSLSGPSWPVLGWTLPLPLPFIYTYVE